MKRSGSSGSPLMRRALLGAAVGAPFVLGGTALAGPKPRLHAFVPSDQKPYVVQRDLQSSLAAFTVTVFGRSRDFEDAVRADGPEAVLAPAPVLVMLGIPATLQGLMQGATEESYSLVTVGGAVNPSSLGPHPVGVLGMMGREKMKDFCERLLGTSNQHIKTVTKYEDLLPLLQFNQAKGVILPRRLTSVVVGRSELQLTETTLARNRVGLVALSVRDVSVAPQLVAAVRALGASPRAYLGVDGWQ